MPVYRGAGGAGDATNDATVTAVQAAATSAATSATNAANSATAAANSATGAATSATNASNSATTAAGQATTAAGHATNASTFATNSSLSATDSADSATEAEGYASEAFNYKVAASLSEGNASDYADAAQASQLAAETAALAVDNVLTDPDFITVLGLSDELQTVAANSANITAVANNAANINAVEANETNIDLVAANISDIGIVAEKEADIDTVAGIAANVTTVAGISSNVTTVAGISANVTTVATNNANVTTVATNIASVNTNATNIANINQNAANIVAIQNASANATAAATSATAAAGSATSASASAAAASAVALGNEPVRHSVRPSLLLDFANTKTLDPRITFTRASTATFYDGKTVAKAEENLFTYSEQLDNAYWTKGALTITANSATAPDGTSTAELVTEDSSAGVHHLYNTTLISVSNTAVTGSVYLKNNTRQYGCLSIWDGSTYHGIVVDLTNGTITQTNGTLTSSSVTLVGNGWYRLVITKTINAPTVLNVSTSNSATPSLSIGRPTYTGDGTSSIYIWGAQLEQRSSVTAYTPTTTAPITNYIPALQTAAAGVARFEHNPVTGESLGLEIEEQRTNLQTRSEVQSNWTTEQATITSNTIVAPDGALTGAKLFADTSNNVHRAYPPTVGGLTSGATYTATLHMKAGGYSFGYIRDGFTGNYVIFNLSTGVVSASSSATGAITSIGNGWYRCSASMVASGSNMRMDIGICSTSLQIPSTAFTGNGFDGIYIWGAQLEAGAFATSYIPTVASQVTRSSDAASMTGTNFSSWYRADEGTLYSEFVIGRDSDGSRFFANIDDGTNTNAIDIRSSNIATIGTVISASGSQQVNISVTAPSIGSTCKAAVTYKVNDFAFTANAQSVLTDTSGIAPVNPNRFTIGSYNAGAGNFVNTTIAKVAYYPRRLTNAELQGVTTV